MELIPQKTIQHIRESFPATSYEIEYGSASEGISTGRATCRCCGKKIGKGLATIEFHWDFRGNGSYTAGKVYIHKDNCI